MTSGGSREQKKWESITPRTIEPVTTVANGAPTHRWILGASVKHTSKLFQTRYKEQHIYTSILTTVQGLIHRHSLFRGPSLLCAWSENAPVARKQPHGQSLRASQPSAFCGYCCEDIGAPQQLHERFIWVSWGQVGQKSSWIRWDFKCMNSWKGMSWFSVEFKSNHRLTLKYLNSLVTGTPPPTLQYCRLNQLRFSPHSWKKYWSKSNSFFFFFWNYMPRYRLSQNYNPTFLTPGLEFYILHHKYQWFTKCDIQRSNISINWKCVRKSLGPTPDLPNQELSDLVPGMCFHKVSMWLWCMPRI